MREYFKPLFEEEVIEVEDIIAASPTGPMDNPYDDYDPEQPGDSISI